MINPQTLAQMMRLNQQDAQKLESVWNQAQSLSANVSTQQQALDVLKQNGVNNQFLTKVQNWLNNPMAGMVAKMAGIDLTNVRSAINSLNNDVNQAPNVSAQQQIQAPVQQTQVQQNNFSQMDKLRQGLQQLRGISRN